METIETLGKYEIRRTLGKGAMGTVYEGWDPIIARRVAIKTVRIPDHGDDPETEEALARFRREAQAAGRLIHPNIVGVFDYGETNDLAYIVMEFVDGPSVKSLVDQHERFELATTLRIMTDLLNGLQFSHGRGVVHRDIKPANIMLTSEGQAKIADFGIARIESSSMTQAGTVLGTPAYMSPEQFMGQVVDSRTDLYSTGVVLYQLLTGERPFEGGMSAIMHKALNTDPPLPSQISVTSPPLFDAVVRKAMAKRPEHRFQTAVEFVQALQAAAAGKPLPGSEADEASVEATMIASGPRRPELSAGAAADRPVAAPAPAPATASAVRRSSLPMLAGVAVVALALLGGGAWFLLLRGGSTPAGTTTVAANTTQAAPASASRTASRTASPPAAPAAAPAASAVPAAAATPPVPQPAAGPASGAPPGGVQTAAIGLGATRDQIMRLVAGQSCALVDGVVADSGNVTLTGVAGTTEAAALRQTLNALGLRGAADWQVKAVDPVFCPSLDLLHRIVPVFGAAGPRLGLTLAEGRTRLHDGEHILPRITMPGFPAHLIVDYVGHDGSLQHLYPQVADPKDQLSADLPHVFRAGETVDLGNVRPGHPAWEAGPPYGTDMIIAIASSQPLFDRPRPGDAESAADYLRALRAAVDAAQQRGVQLAGNALTLDTLPR